MPDLPPLTILLGPQTRLCLSINALVRTGRAELLEAGVDAMPSRLASPILRRCLDDRPLDDRVQEFAASTPNRPAFLSAVNFFGAPPAGMVHREMFPEAERSLAGLAEIAPRARLILCVDALPAFFLASGSGPLEARVNRTPWEALFELSWVDLAREIRAALPDAALTVLTPDGSARHAHATLRLLFGTAIMALSDPHALLRAAISDTGQVELDRLVDNGQASDMVLAELYGSHAPETAPDEIETRLGLDRVTHDLLVRRFSEDLAELRAMPGIRVI